MNKPKTAGRRVVAPKKIYPPKRIGDGRSFHLDRRADSLANEIARAGKPDDLLTQDELAAALSVTTQWLRIIRHDNTGPAHTKPFPTVTAYGRGIVVKWLKVRARLYANTHVLEDA